MGIFERLVERGRGKILETFVGEYLDHPSGGCRMGDDPSESVCDGTGRTHDHENLWIIGSPTCVSSGCLNSTLTFVALSLRTATFLDEEFPRRS
jgi:quinoprotein glucose dehydrogenase